MLFRQIFDSESSNYTYIIASGMGREGIIIDPVFNKITQYIKLVNQLELKLVAAIDTHMHADHITGIGPLGQQSLCVPMMGKETKAECVNLKRFHDNELLNFDGIRLQCLYTPGHTNDSYCFLMEDRVFTGDTLFIRSTGRTDFQGGSASLQYDSLFQRLLTLDEMMKVYPGHDYNGMTVSTIGEEKKYNPRLQVKSREEYIDLMSNLNLPKPKLFNITVPANLKCGLVNDVNHRKEFV
ncbi:MBL fold metallo-hydrolase [Legionella spiritensis]|uniref:MBL fold metallo-hydrolase n=1 Tax=Legionella spiritensis TaxID=452 RepID=UPI000F6B7C9B|nr:MBL fold metallo-hydrolase [Legionella spiritensis]VEG89670.1 hydroxyacylglutathione hydrolase [Legionella spiritensis]